MKKITEEKNPTSNNIDDLSLIQILKVINKEDQQVPYIIEQHLSEIELITNNVINSFQNNGTLYYVGCGSSGRLGVLDAAECTPTFSVSNKMVQGIIAGGKEAMFNSIEGAEDNFQEGYDKLHSKKINKNDIVIGISASGSANYVLGALKFANKVKASTALITFNNISNINYIDNIISIIVGPEIITGSTRMKAGTATKIILNMITTSTMIKLNKTYKNLMVDLKPSNNKLIDRAVRIISELTKLDYSTSKKILIKAKNNVKIAVVMHQNKVSYSTARLRIKLNNGSLRKSLE